MRSLAGLVFGTPAAPDPPRGHPHTLANKCGTRSSCRPDDEAMPTSYADPLVQCAGARRRQGGTSQETTALSAEQIAAFEDRGYVRLREAFSPAAALRMQERMWAELRKDFGIDRDDRSTWWQPPRSLRRAKWDPLQSAVATERLIGAIDGLLGAVPWNLPSNWGLVMVTFPELRGEWTLPTTGWHFDFDLHRNAASLGGLFVFTFFSAVEPRGGGTLIVEGSHRLLRRFHGELSPAERQDQHRKLRRRFLRYDSWLKALTSAGSGPEDRIDYFMRETREVLGVPVRVVELTGQPGDAIVCHPLMLHVAAPNCLETPRFMRTQRICEDPQPAS